MTIQEIIDCIEKLAPPALQESFDNSGLIIGNHRSEATGVLICIDLSVNVVEEAIKLKCNLIVSHHPAIFNPIKKIVEGSNIQKILFALIRNDIALYAAHTSLDNTKGGMNFMLASMLGLSDIRFLQPMKGILKKLVTFCPAESAEKVRNAVFAAGAGNIGNYDSCSFNQRGEGSFRANDKANPFVGKKNQLHFEPEVRIETIFPVFLQTNVVQTLLQAHPYEEVAYDIYPIENDYPLAGSGVYGKLPKPLSEQAFIVHVKNCLSLKHVRYCNADIKTIASVAICGGSGSFLINNALQCKADAFVTSDIRYHDFQYAEGRILLIDAGHYETEVIAKEILKEVLCQKFPNFAVLIAKTDRNPVKYS